LQPVYAASTAENRLNFDGHLACSLDFNALRLIKLAAALS
jgi:hypothetical protein